MELQETRTKTETTRLKKTYVVLRSAVSKITVEPLVFLYHLHTGMINIVTQNLIQEKICEKFYNGTKAECRNYLTAFNGTLTADHIQQDASDYTLYTNLITNLPSIILVLFLAPWSDRNGRKLIIMLPLIGVTLMTVCYTVVSCVESSTPQDILLSMVPGVIGGGTTLFLIGCYSYLSDVTEQKERTTRMAIFEGISIGGSSLGSLTGAQIYSTYGYPTVYVASIAINILLIPYVSFSVKNVKPDRTESQEEVSNVSFVTNILDNVRVCFKRREGFLRAFIVLLLLNNVLCQFPDNGEGNMLYLYTREMYDWDTTMYSRYNSYLLTMRSAGVILLMPILSRRFHTSDIVLGLSSGCIRIIDGTVKTFSYTPIILWLDGVLVLADKFGFVVNRSMISKCIPPNELGKVFAVDSILSIGFSSLAVLLYTQVYKVTVAVFPGCIFLVPIAVSLPTIAIFIFIRYTLKKQTILKLDSLQ